MKEELKQGASAVKKGVSIVGKIIKWFFIAILIVVAIVIGYSVYTCTAVTKAVVDVAGGSAVVKDAIKDAVNEATGKQDAPLVVDVEVSPKDLYAAYDGNEVKADNLYKGKVLKITGSIDDIGKDILDKAYVKFNADEYGLSGVQVYIKSSELDKLGELEKGEDVTIVGVCEGKSLTNILVKNAAFE